MKSKYLTSCLIIFIGFFTQASLVKYEKEQEVKTDSASFKISAGWSYDSEYKKLISPEADLIAYIG